MRYHNMRHLFSGEIRLLPTHAQALFCALMLGCACGAPANADPASPASQPDSSATQAAAGASRPSYLDPDQPIERRVEDLLARLTADEKAAQLFNDAPAIPRLDIPHYDWWSEALHGVGGNGVATVFPQAIGVGATWDAGLWHEAAEAIGTEARAKHHETVRQGGRPRLAGLTVWSPNINIFRDPRWGRGQETYGEDPFLTARLGVAFVTGLQGEDPKYLRVLATPKHFAVHSGPEPLRHAFDARVSRHDLLDTYLPAFRATVVEGQAGSVMCSYNRVNGDPACANTFLLKDELREAWQFKGYVVSDCGAISDIDRQHHVTSGRPQSVALSLRAGTDLDCDLEEVDEGAYRTALQQGLLTEKDLDTALRRLFTARFKLGMFDPPERVRYAQIPYSENDSEAHRALALQVGRESMVLLKNTGVLPLKETTQRIAVIGPLADTGASLVGTYNGVPSRATTVLQGVRAQFPHAHVEYAAGTPFLLHFNAVPGEFLSTSAGQPGLSAEYFGNTDLSGPPAAARIDRQIALGFLADALPVGVGSGSFSVRWTGRLRVPESGTYKLSFGGQGGYRLWLDGKLVIDNWKGLPVISAAQLEGADRSAQLRLESGRYYAVKLEFWHRATPGLKGIFADLGTIMVFLCRRAELADTASAVAAAKAADVVVAVVGITPELENEEMENPALPPGFKGGDRTSLDLPAPEEELLEAVKATGKPLIVVLMNGSALGVNWASHNADAILEAWYPGEEGGTAVAETLAGRNNPAGRLPVTFYRSVDDLPPFEDYSMKGRTYRYFEGTPLYPFGHGLSYSRFEYGSLRLSSARVHAGDALHLNVEVRNASPRDADEVAQLYLTFPKAEGVPLRALRGFQRVHLKGGERRRLEFVLEPRELSWVDADGRRVVGPGTFHLFVGGGQPGTAAPGAEQTFTVTGQQRLPD